jgi:phosphoribosylformimino-5-aminoimidazole carboxamide ribotide isomerase
MQIWPAIDLRAGRCVRLRQGDYAQETVFSDDPVVVARQWSDQGAEFLHLVDLDGAREGRPANLDVVRRIRQAVEMTCELGGGIRNEQIIREYFDIGMDRLVIGTQAIVEPDWFRAMCSAHPGRIVLGIDARDGRVATEGWLETSDVAATELARQHEDVPLAAVIYTDIATDGMLAGPNTAAMAQMRAATQTPLIASGGVTTPEDINQLADAGVAGCIVGRALYEGRLTLAEAFAAAASHGAT